MISLFKFILIGVSVLLLNACATGTMYDTKRASARSQGLIASSIISQNGDPTS
jgi:hypothetical protein